MYLCKYDYYVLSTTKLSEDFMKYKGRYFALDFMSVNTIATCCHACHTNSLWLFRLSLCVIKSFDLEALLVSFVCQQPDRLLGPNHFRFQAICMKVMYKNVIWNVHVLFQQPLADHHLKTISFIADIKHIIVVMARLSSDSDGNKTWSGKMPDFSGLEKQEQKTTKVICHVFETSEVCFFYIVLN